MYNTKSIYQITKLARDIKDIFYQYETLTPEMSVDLTIQPDQIQVNMYPEVVVTVEQESEVPYSFIESLVSVFKEQDQQGTLTIRVEGPYEDTAYIDDFYDSQLAVWEFTISERYDKGYTINYTLSPDEAKLSRRQEWPIYASIQVTSYRLDLVFEGDNSVLKKLESYEQVLEDVNLLLTEFNLPKLHYKPLQTPQLDTIIGRLAEDIQSIESSIQNEEDGYLGTLYRLGAKEIHRECQLYFNLGEKKAYFSYNVMGYNYYWNAPSPDKHQELNYSAQYTLNDLNNVGLSSSKWIDGDLAGRCLRELHTNNKTFNDVQTVFSEHLGNLFNQNDWFFNQGYGSGIVLTLDVFVKELIETVVEQNLTTIYLTRDDKVAVVIKGYKTINADEGIYALNTLRQRLFNK